jgi:membrane protease subunit HflK
LPYPVEAVDLVELLAGPTIEIGYRNGPKNKVEREALMLTDDENIIDIQFAVQYNLKIRRNTCSTTAARRPSHAAETAMREVVGKAKMDFALYEGREQIAAQAEKLMQDMLDRYQTGIVVQKVTLQNVQPPDKVQAAFDDAVKAGQDRERQVNEGQAYANDVIPRARGARRGCSRRPTATRAGSWQKAEGDGSAASGRCWSSTRRRRRHPRAPLPRHDAIGALQHQQDPGRHQKGAGNLLYLPLDKLMQAAGAPAAGHRVVRHGHDPSVGAQSLPNRGRCSAAIEDPDALARIAAPRPRGGSR